MLRKKERKKEDKTVEETMNEQLRSMYPNNSYYDDYSFKYGGVEYDYDRTSCTGNCDGICRCKKIIDEKIVSVDTTLIINEFVKPFKNVVLKYCIDRIIRNAELSENDFSINKCGGYYGEEALGVNIDESFYKKVSKELLKTINLSDLDNIKNVLILEYGYLLNYLNGNNLKVYVENIKIDSILSRSSVEYNKKIKDTSNYYGENYILPRGIIYNEQGIVNKLLVDGNHRVFEANKLGLKTIPMIIIEKEAV